MNDTQYGLPAPNSEVWLSQSSGVAYRADASRHHAEPCINRSAQKNQNLYPCEQAIEVEAIEIETLHAEAVEVQAIDMQRIAHEIPSNSVKPLVQPTPAQEPNPGLNPGLLDIGFWLNLPE